MPTLWVRMPLPMGNECPYLWGISAHREGHLKTTPFRRNNSEYSEKQWRSYMTFSHMPDFMMLLLKMMIYE